MLAGNKFNLCLNIFGYSHISNSVFCQLWRSKLARNILVDSGTSDPVLSCLGYTGLSELKAMVSGAARAVPWGSSQFEDGEQFREFGNGHVQ